MIRMPQRPRSPVPSVPCPAWRGEGAGLELQTPRPGCMVRGNVSSTWGFPSGCSTPVPPHTPSGLLPAHRAARGGGPPGPHGGSSKSFREAPAASLHMDRRMSRNMERGLPRRPQPTPPHPPFPLLPVIADMTGIKGNSQRGMGGSRSVSTGGGHTWDHILLQARHCANNR